MPKKTQEEKKPEEKSAVTALMEMIQKLEERVTKLEQKYDRLRKEYKSRFSGALID